MDNVNKMIMTIEVDQTDLKKTERRLKRISKLTSTISKDLKGIGSMLKLFSMVVVAIGIAMIGAIETVVIAVKYLKEFRDGGSSL